MFNMSRVNAGSLSGMKKSIAMMSEAEESSIYAHGEENTNAVVIS